VLEQLGAGGVEVVAMEETLSRNDGADRAGRTGLAQVYRDLLTYEGSELYFKRFPELTGQPFSVAQWKMEGRGGGRFTAGRRARDARPRPPVLNPKEDVLLEANDELLVIAVDDDTFLPHRQSSAGG